MKQTRKAIVALVICLAIATSLCAVAFASETRWLVDCVECNRGTMVEHVEYKPALEGDMRPCSHGKAGFDEVYFQEIWTYEKCNNCGYSTNPTVTFEVVQVICNGY